MFRSTNVYQMHLTHSYISRQRCLQDKQTVVRDQCWEAVSKSLCCLGEQTWKIDVWDCPKGLLSYLWDFLFSFGDSRSTELKRASSLTVGVGAEKHSVTQHLKTAGRIWRGNWTVKCQWCVCMCSFWLSIHSPLFCGMFFFSFFSE